MNATRSTLEYRAAEYVGREDMPRRSVKLDPKTVLIVWDDPNVSALIYTEHHGHRPSGHTFMLTPRRAATLRSMFEDWNRS